MQKTIDALIEQLKKVNEENEKLKFRLSNIMRSLPSDEDIAKWVKEHGYYGHCTSEWHEGLEEGAKWMKEEIRKLCNDA
jgi:arylsulfatase A-like enzyme